MTGKKPVEMWKTSAKFTHITTGSASVDYYYGAGVGPGDGFGKVIILTAFADA